MEQQRLLKQNIIKMLDDDNVMLIQVDFEDNDIEGQTEKLVITYARSKE